MITEQEAIGLAESKKRQVMPGGIREVNARLAEWAIQELARREAERAERARPIDAEWLESIGAYHEWNHGGDAGWYGIEIDDDEWLSVSGATGLTHIVMCDGVKQIERRFDTRGQLLDILAALKGGET